jgi:hypothetical protein
MKILAALFLISLLGIGVFAQGEESEVVLKTPTGNISGTLTFPGFDHCRFGAYRPGWQFNAWTENQCV